MRYFTDIFSKITFRTMRQNRRRTIVTVVGVILSSAMITAVTTFGQSMWSFLKNYSIEHDGYWFGVAEYVSDAEYERIRNDSRVEMAVATDILGYARYDRLTDEEKPYLYIQSLSDDVWDIFPVTLTEGRLPENEHEVIISEYQRSNEDQDQITRVGDVLELEVGERIWEGERLTSFEGYMGGTYAAEYDLSEETLENVRHMSFTVVGVFSMNSNMHYGAAGYDVYAGAVEDPDAAVTDAGSSDEENPGGDAPDEMISETGTRSMYHDVYLRTVKPSDIYDYMNTIECDRASTNEALLRWFGVADNDNLTGIITGLSLIVTGIIMAGAISLIYNAFSISLRERTVQFGLLASVGATKKQLERSMLSEALFVSLVGIPAGCISGIAGIGITLHFIGSGITRWIHGEAMDVPLQVSWISVAAAVLTAFATVMISVWIPCRRVRKISPIDAIRSEKDIRIRGKDVKTKTTGLFYRLFGLEGMLARKNYKRDRKKYRSTVASLTMSIVLFVSVSVFGEYLMGTGNFVLEMPDVQIICQVNEGDEDIWQDVLGKTEELAEENDKVIFMQRYSTTGRWLQIDMKDSGIGSSGSLDDYYIVYSSEDGDLLVDAKIYIIPDELFESMGGNVQEENRLPVLYPEKIRVFNSKTERYERREFLPESGVTLPVEIEDFTDEGKILYEQLCSAVFQGTYEKMPEGVIYNANIFGVSLLTCESGYDRFLAGNDELGRVYSLGIQCTDHMAVYRDLSEGLKAYGMEDYLFDNADSYEQSRQLMTAANVLSYGFIILISLISVANVFNTISTNLMLRRREFAMLRSVGMAGKGFRRMMCYECLLYGLRSVMYGVVLALAVSVLIYRVISGGVDISYIVPWKYLLIAVACVFVVVGITMVYTMRIIQKQNIIDELRMN